MKIENYGNFANYGYLTHQTKAQVKGDIRRLQTEYYFLIEPDEALRVLLMNLLEKEGE